MVTHPHQLAAGRGAEPTGQLGDVGLVQAEVAVLLAETPIDVLSLQSACGNRSGRRVEYGLRIAETNRDHVHVVQPATGVLETPLDRPDRRCVGSVLDPVETLLLDHRDELSVHEDGRRVVEPVGVRDPENDHLTPTPEVDLFMSKRLQTVLTDSTLTLVLVLLYTHVSVGQ